jgi:hypothetical protein
VKGWYMYCMGLATYDPSTWGISGPRAWRRGRSTAARVSASLLISLPEEVTFPNGLFLWGHRRQRGV